jgi:hypothetical protein
MLNKYFKGTGINLFSLFYMIFFIIIVVYYNCVLIPKNKKENIKECEDFHALQINGKVDTAFFDTDINVKSFVIKFTKGTSFRNPFFFKSLNGLVKSGDSILKPNNSFKFYRFEKLQWILISNQDSINCNDY